MRLFVAIDLSSDTRAQLGRVREALRRHLDAASRAPRVTWVADDAAHVTVRFVGEVADDTVERVRAAVVAPFAMAPYAVEFSGLGAFPDRRRPRALWIGVSEGEAPTAALAAAVNARLDPIVGRGDDRPFRAHLTLARVKEVGRFDWDRAFAAIDAGRTTTTIDHLTLYRSTTSPKGPTYTALGVAPLRGTDGGARV